MTLGDAAETLSQSSNFTSADAWAVFANAALALALREHEAAGA